MSTAELTDSAVLLLQERVHSLERRVAFLEQRGTQSGVEGKVLADNAAVQTFVAGENQKDSLHGVHPFQESVWDAAVWIGTAAWCDSILTGTMIVLNIFMQFYFCLLLALNLGDLASVSLSDDDLTSFLHWRISSAQHIQYYDEVSNTSLASLLCGDTAWGKTTSSYHQLDVYSDFQDYLGDGEMIDKVLGGPGLCLLALACWFCLVADDVLNNYEYSHALIHVAQRHSEILPPCTIKHLSWIRVLLNLLLVSLPRFVVSVLLFFYGARFLIYTANLSDLILNAMALGFVMDLDGLLFAFVPEGVRRAVRNAEPLLVASQKLKIPVNFVRPFFVLVVIACMVVSEQLLMEEVITRMTIAQDVLCGGEAAFVYVVDPATGSTLIAGTAEPEVMDVTTYTFQSVLAEAQMQHSVMPKLADLVSLQNWQPQSENLTIETDIENLRLYEDYTAEEAQDVLECRDLIEIPAHLYPARETIQDQTVVSCADLENECSSSTVRMFCPSTCACDTMYSGMYDRTGCSSSCITLVQAEVETVTAAMKEQGDDSPKCGVQGTDWQGTFLEELQAALVSENIVEQIGTDVYRWTTGFLEQFSVDYYHEYGLEDVNVKLDTWLDTSVGQGVCDAIFLFDNLFSTDLCTTSASLTADKGTLEGVCPKTCGLCTRVAFAGTYLSMAQLADKQSSFLSDGLIAFPFFEQARSAPVLSCGSFVAGSTVNGTYLYGTADSPELTYNFTLDTDATVTFSTCDAADFDSYIRVYDDAWSQLAENDDASSCDFTSEVSVSLSGGQTYHVLVEGYRTASGVFQLSAYCN